MLKMVPFDCAINEKCCSVERGRGICRLFSSPPPVICHPRQKNCQCPGVSWVRGWGVGEGRAQVELTDVLGLGDKGN